MQIRVSEIPDDGLRLDAAKEIGASAVAMVLIECLPA
jgi:hypothetical protein